MVQLFYLSEADSGVQFGDAIVIADKGMQIGAAVDTGMVMAVIRIGVQFYIKVFVVGDDGAAFPTGDCFYKVEREGSRMTDGSQRATFVAGSKTLTGVFEQDEIMFLADSGESFEIGHCAAHMNGHHAFCAGGDGAADCLRRQGQRVVDIRQNGDGTDAKHGFETGYECKSGHDDLIAGANTKAGQGGREGRGSAGGELCKASA